MSKKYYWLKLNEDFFEDDTTIWLEEQENGKDYVIFYLKLLLKSLKEDGKLIRYVGEIVMPYDTKALAKLTNTNFDTVHTAMQLFEQIGLIQRINTGELYLTQIDEMIGSETDSAKRVRKHRALKGISNNNEQTLQCNTSVTKCNTEIEKEIEIELDKEIEKDKPTPSTEKEIIPYKEILEHLSNVKEMPQGYKLVNGNKKDIKARWNEGYRLDDFIHVIDVKAEEWLVEPKRGEQDTRVWVRPSTLFGNKFDQYLNQEVEEKEEEVSYKYKTIDDIDLKEVGEVDF